MVGAIVQARMGATRLPGKVLLTAAGKPLLLHMLERLRQARRLEQIIVATTTNPADDVIVKVAAAAGFLVYRGSEQDVLDRYYQAARQFGVDPIVRVTADCPLIDPEIVDAVIELFQREHLDHAGNGLPPTYPDGLDAEAFSFAALEQAWREAKLPSEREHVSSFIWNQPQRFRSGNVANDVDYSHLRWTLDYPEDYELLKRLIEALAPNGEPVRFPGILRYLEQHPTLSQLNAKYARNEGYAKSLREDATATGGAVNQSDRQRILQGDTS